jgi:hypothetical protein
VEELSVVLMDMSPMLRGILRTLVGGEPGLRVSREYTEFASLRAAVDDNEANIVVFGDGSPRLEDDCRELLEARPRVKLFVVGGDGRRTTLYELRPHRENLGEVAPRELLAAMRSAAETTGW